jgi:RimJ/RimL family protein N-acetyltransferase
LRISEARPEDAARLERLRVRAWREAYPGLVEQHVLDELDEDDPMSVLVWKNLIENVDMRVAMAENEGGDLIGFCAVAGPSRDADEPEGVAEIIALYVDPDHYRQGVGREMLSAVINEVSESDRDWNDLTVWTLERNHRALRLYESFGFERDGKERTDEHWKCPDVRLRLAL